MAWNQYLWPLLITEDTDMRTVQIGLKSLSAGQVDALNVVMAGTVIAALPILVLLLAFQRNLIRGLTAGAVKIGSASCRERVCQYVSILVVAGSLKKKKYIIP